MNSHHVPLRLMRLLPTLALRRVTFTPVSDRSHSRILTARSFSSSTYRRATEGNTGIKNDLNVVEEVDKSPLSAILSEHPQLWPSIHKFIEIAQEEGIDLTNPKPSFSTLMKMAGNQRIKDAALNLRGEFEAAGLEMSKEDALNLLSVLKDKNE